MYDAVLRDPAFFRFLLRIDQELAAETRRAGCQHCAGALHVADFPRKPRGCPAAVIEDYSWRFSFTCGRCDQRATSASVRFLGRRVYVAAVLVLGLAAAGSVCPTIVCSPEHSTADATALAPLVDGGVSAHTVLASHAQLLHPTGFAYSHPTACWIASISIARPIGWHRHCAFYLR